MSILFKAQAILATAASIISATYTMMSFFKHRHNGPFQVPDNSIIFDSFERFIL